MGKAVSASVREKEAANLKKILGDRGYGENGLTYSAFATVAKIPGGKSLLSQHLHGDRPISIASAKSYAKSLQCDIREISERLAELLTEQIPFNSKVEEPPAPTYNVIAPDFSDQRIKQVVEIMLSTDTEGRIKALEAVRWALRDHQTAKKGNVK